MIRRKNNQQKKTFSASEKELFALFDYQRFENDPVLKALIDECEQSREIIINELKEKLCELKKKSKYNADCAIGLLEGGKAF